MMTKDEVSDLKSLIDRIVQCEKDSQTAALCLAQAKGNLASALWNLEHGKKEEK